MQHRPGGDHRDWPEWARTDRVWADGGWTDGLGAAYDWPRPGWPPHRRPRGASGPPRDRRAAAFAEGRRLREAAERRRALQYRTGPPLAVKLVALFLAISLVGSVGAVVISVLAFVLTVAAGTAAFVMAHRVSRSLRGRAAGTAPLPARPAAPPRPDLAWSQARSRFDRLRAEYAAYECDPMEVLRLPALADVTVASTGRFVEAFAEAQAL
jgi:hypothetical protein